MAHHQHLEGILVTSSVCSHWPASRLSQRHELRWLKAATVILRQAMLIFNIYTTSTHLSFKHEKWRLLPLYGNVDAGTRSQFDRKRKLSEEKSNILGLRKFRISAPQLDEFTFDFLLLHHAVDLALALQPGKGLYSHFVVTMLTCSQTSAEIKKNVQNEAFAIGLLLNVYGLCQDQLIQNVIGKERGCDKTASLCPLSKNIGVISSVTSVRIGKQSNFRLKIAKLRWHDGLQAVFNDDRAQVTILGYEWRQGIFPLCYFS